jgi:hypothetical protein
MEQNYRKKLPVVTPSTIVCDSPAPTDRCQLIISDSDIESTTDLYSMLIKELNDVTGMIRRTANLNVSLEQVSPP